MPTRGPLTGPVYYPQFFFTSLTTQSLLSQMGLTTHNISITAANNWNHPGTVTRLPDLSRGRNVPDSIVEQLFELHDTGPPIRKPIRWESIAVTATLTLHDNVTVQGCLVTNGQSSAGGSKRKTWQAVLLCQHWDGTTSSIYLPTAVVANNLTVFGRRGKATTQGFLASWNSFQIDQGNANHPASVRRGELVTGEVRHHTSGTQWDQGKLILEQPGIRRCLATRRGRRVHGITYFPVYEQSKQNLNPAPLLTIKPDASTRKLPLEKTRQTPVYVAAQSDGGLRWDLLQVTDSTVRIEGDCDFPPQGKSTASVLHDGTTPGGPNPGPGRA